MKTRTRRTRHVCAMLLASVAVLAATASKADDRVDFTIVARVRFAVPGDWVVLTSKSDKNRTIFAFQIPNPADDKTPDSTNLTVQSYYLKDSASKVEFERKSPKQNPSAQERKLADQWDCASFQGSQGPTSYDVWDCHRTVGEAGIYVRLAWPHLPKNPSDYDQQMQSVLADVLASVVPSPK